MERHSQQSSQRMQDRSIALHHTQPPPPPPLQHQPPPPTYPHFHHASTTQPPTQIPFSDPFRTRDPFMPTTAHGRRGSYGMTPGSAGSAGPTPPSYGERAWSAHSPGTRFILFASTSRHGAYMQGRQRSSRRIIASSSWSQDSVFICCSRACRQDKQSLLLLPHDGQYYIKASDTIGSV